MDFANRTGSTSFRTLRLEARLALYGSDIDRTTTPLEAGLGWTVKLHKTDFIGKQALVKQKEAGVQRKLVCLVMRSRGSPKRSAMTSARPGETLITASARRRASTMPSPDLTIGTVRRSGECRYS